jgi:predicted AlkP superfamily pyrophosphatase or phosphodiesterase
VAFNDRGIKKWHGFFMPDHTKTLRTIWQEDQKIKMPILDEYQLQEFENKIYYAVEYNLPVEFKVVNGGFEEKITGFVHFTDQINLQFHVKNMSDQVIYIRYKEIMDVKIID